MNARPMDLPQPVYRIGLSALSLLAANLVPLAGVLWLGWSVSSVIILYWFENIVIGVINVARLLLLAPAAGAAGAIPAAVAHAAKLFIVPFFIVHYFLFCAGHGVFVFHMFPNEDGFFPEQHGSGLLTTLGNAFRIFSTPLAFAAAALALSHVISFCIHYLGGREFERLDLKSAMILPYRRIIVLHLTIILGGAATLSLGEPIWVLVIMVVIKIAVDLKMHLGEHRRLAEPTFRGSP